MTPGTLRVMLGAAPGVGKTYAMLEEGQRLRAAGKHVAIGLLETHGRRETAAIAEGLDVVPRRRVLHRGVTLEEMDLDAILRLHPEVVLVDELAHTNAPGSSNEKRWQDVAAILDAGIDVLSTVNVQHIESLSDVVQQITGVAQRETIPDAALRLAEQIELVDLAPQALRDRLADGRVYPATRIDAALSNYFRLGNLTALRELALLWLADEVDVALQRYRNEHGIDAPWEARERIVVALTGGPEGETLLRRGARIAARTSGGQLFAVYVSRSDGLAERDPASLSTQRALVETLGGSYHQVVAEDVPAALVKFARGVDATQLVVGVSRRGRFARFFGGAGTGATIIRLAEDIDVHIVSHAQAGARHLPRIGGALSPRRQLAGLGALVVGLPLLTALLLTFRGPDAVTSHALGYQLFVVVIALIGGLWPALLAAAAAALLLDYFFVDPLHTVTVSNPLHLVALGFFVIVAALVSLVVDQAARRSNAAIRSAAEADVLVTIAGSIIGGADALQALVSRFREAFGMASVILRQNGEVLYVATDAGTLDDSDQETSIPLGESATLQLRGKKLAPSDRRILDAFLAQIETALEQRRLSTEAASVRPLAAADRLRSALLAAVGHDLRRPLASATAAVTSLRATDVRLSESDQHDLLETADESLHALSSLVIDLLDVSRLQAGVLALTATATECETVIMEALDEVGLAPGEVTLQLEPVKPVLADTALLQRVVVNLLTNALRFSPDGTAPIIATSQFGGRVQLRVVDSGPGIPTERRDEVFVPFQRLGDTDNTAGVGLGLALAKGFTEAMSGTLEVEDTPGGGLTMVVELPEAPE
jgi:two-component system sensor histidine kinase KdpD